MDSTATTTDVSEALHGEPLADAMRRRDEDTVALLWEELARTSPVMFAVLWRRPTAPTTRRCRRSASRVRPLAGARYPCTSSTAATTTPYATTAARSAFDGMRLAMRPPT